METSGDPLRRIVNSIPETSIPSEIDPNWQFGHSLGRVMFPG